jgi:hypothetical protein
LTRLDDLRDYLRNKNNKKSDVDTSKEIQQEKVSLEVAGSDSTTNPLASFGDDDMDKDLIDQLYSSARNRVPKGEGVTWDQD